MNSHENGGVKRIQNQLFEHDKRYFGSSERLVTGGEKSVEDTEDLRDDVWGVVLEQGFDTVADHVGVYE